MSHQTQNFETSSATAPWTQGVAHVGLTVRDLDVTVDFFVSVLGYKKLGAKPDYPAAFVTDGKIMITLWQVKVADEKVVPFNRLAHIGLHHLALSVANDRLDPLHERLKNTANCDIEFAPQLAGNGPSRHMMVAIAGSGIRVEFRSNG